MSSSFILLQQMRHRELKIKNLKIKEYNEFTNRLNQHATKYNLKEAQFIHVDKELIGIRFIFENEDGTKSILDHVPRYNNNVVYYKKLLRKYNLYTDALAETLKEETSCILF